MQEEAATDFDIGPTVADTLRNIVQGTLDNYGDIVPFVDRLGERAEAVLYEGEEAMAGLTDDMGYDQMEPQEKIENIERAQTAFRFKAAGRMGILTMRRFRRHIGADRELSAPPAERNKVMWEQHDATWSLVFDGWEQTHDRRMFQKHFPTPDHAKFARLVLQEAYMSTSQDFNGRPLRGMRIEGDAKGAELYVPQDVIYDIAEQEDVGVQRRKRGGTGEGRG